MIGSPTAGVRVAVEAVLDFPRRMVEFSAPMAQRYSASPRWAGLIATVAFALLPAFAASQPPPPISPLPDQPQQKGVEEELPGAVVQFDALGVDFGPWLRALIPPMKRNWKNQTAAIQDKGHVVVTFEVHRDGTIAEVRVKERSAFPSIDQAALKTVMSSSPAPPLPSEFPKDTCPFQITLYCNEVAPRPIRRPEASGASDILPTAVDPGRLAPLSRPACASTHSPTYRTSQASRPWSCIG